MANSKGDDGTREGTRRRDGWRSEVAEAEMKY